MSQPGSKNLTSQQALDLILAYLNDGGEAGATMPRWARGCRT